MEIWLIVCLISRSPICPNRRGRGNQLAMESALLGHLGHSHRTTTSVAECFCYCNISTLTHTTCTCSPIGLVALACSTGVAEISPQWVCTTPYIQHCRMLQPRRYKARSRQYNEQDIDINTVHSIHTYTHTIWTVGCFVLFCAPAARRCSTHNMCTAY